MSIEKLPHLPTQDELSHGDTAMENRWKINELVKAFNNWQKYCTETLLHLEDKIQKASEK